MRTRLPEEVFRRPKTGFTLPLDTWMQGSLRIQCEAAVETLAACPLFDTAEVGRLWAELRDPRIDDHWSRRLALVVLGSYLQSLPTSVPP
jgi:asparagine synthetase B (glutamine-hydrolysing)